LPSGRQSTQFATMASDGLARVSPRALTLAASPLLSQPTIAAAKPAAALPTAAAKPAAGLPTAAVASPKFNRPTAGLKTAVSKSSSALFAAPYAKAVKDLSEAPRPLASKTSAANAATTTTAVSVKNSTAAAAAAAEEEEELPPTQVSFKSVLRIRDTLVRIRGSVVPLTNGSGSGSCHFRQ
jgi:hypothetical protein